MAQLDNQVFLGTVTASNLTGTNTGDVTIGTANGLSLAGQALSLAAAIAGGASGALTGADKTKLDATSGTNTGDVTLGAVGSSPNANGMTLAGQVLNLEPASGSQPGIVTTGAQTFGGAKTFAGNILTDLGTFDSNVADAVNAQGFTFNALNLTAVNSRYPFMVKRAGTNVFWLRGDGQAEFFQGPRITSTGSQNYLGNSSMFSIGSGGFVAASSSARADLNQQQSGQDLAIYCARTMSAGNFAVRLGSSIASGSVDVNAKLLMVGCGLTGSNGVGTERLSVLGDGCLSWNTSEFTDGSGTAGNQTIDKVTGIVKIAGGGTTMRLTNSKIRQYAQVDCVILTNDATAYIKNVDTTTAGQADINLGAACTGDIKIRFRVHG